VTRLSVPSTPASRSTSQASSQAAASTSGSPLLNAADYCLAVLAGISVVLVYNVHYLLTQPYWLDEAWVADTLRAPLGQVPQMASSTPLGWILLLRLVPGHGLERQRLVPLAFAALAVALGYLLGRELRLTRFAAGLLTAAAVLLSPAMLARDDLKQYTAEACAALLLWLLVAGLENSWSRWRLTALAVTASAGCLLASTAIMTGVAALGCLGLESLIQRQWRRLAEVAVASAGTLAIYAVVYEVVIKPSIDPQLAYIWFPHYLPGGQKNALSFLLAQFRLLAPYLGFPGRAGKLATVAGVAGGIMALALLRRYALAALLPVTLLLVITASWMRIYPFGDERTSTFWLVMVPVMMAIAAAAAIQALTQLVPRARLAPPTWARWAAAGVLTAAALAIWVPANASSIRAMPLNPQNPVAQIRYVEAHFRPGDVILVNSEASYAFAYYNQTPTNDYPSVAVAANGFIPQYPGDPWIIIATDRDQYDIDNAVARANDIIAAEPRGHRGRVWIITDHVGWEEGLFWREALTGGTITTHTFRKLNGRPQEPLTVYEPFPTTPWGASAGVRDKVWSLTHDYSGYM
jgi:hypothetical protein